jgi:hypothetical protein
LGKKKAKAGCPERFTESFTVYKLDWACAERVNARPAERANNFKEFFMVE